MNTSIQEHCEENTSQHVVRGSNRLIAWIGFIFLKLLAWTWRIEIKRCPGDDALWQKISQAAIFVFWHDQQLMMPFLYSHRCWSPRPKKLAMLISAHRDGQIIAGIVQKFGIYTVAGSSSRGGAKALISLEKHLHKGDTVAITPDGPRGPRHVAKSGAAKLCQLSKFPVIAIAANSSSGKRFASWDKMLLPYPFAKISLSVSENWIQSEDDLVSLESKISMELAGVNQDVGAI